MYVVIGQLITTELEGLGKINVNWKGIMLQFSEHAKIFGKEEL